MKKEELKTRTSSVVLADNTEESFELNINFKSDVDTKRQVAVSVLSLEIVSAFNDINRGYFTILPKLAAMLSIEPWKDVENCKSANQFLIQLTGCSKATASELIKVANRFYTSTGEIQTWLEKFTYSELVQLSSLKDDAIQEISECIGDKHTRQEVVQAIKDYQTKKILEEAGIDPEQIEENSESESEKNEYTESEENSAFESDDYTRWLAIDKLDKLADELTKCSKGKMSKTEMQAICFRALNTISAFRKRDNDINPFE